MRLSLVYALCHLYVAFANTSDSIHTKPHIFLVLVDDLGWANLGNRAGGGNGSTTVDEATVTIHLVSSDIWMVMDRGLQTHCARYRAA